MLEKFDNLIVILLLLFIFYLVILLGAGKKKGNVQMTRYLRGVRILVIILAIVGSILWLISFLS